MANLKTVSRLIVLPALSMRRLSAKIITGLIFALCLFIWSCDCLRDGSGVVVDINTNQPIDSVLVRSYIGKVREKSFEYEMLTDSSGNFTGTTGMTGGGFGGCPDLVMVFSKTGYISLTLKNPYNATVKLSKE